MILVAGEVRGRTQARGVNISCGVEKDCIFRYLVFTFNTVLMVLHVRINAELLEAEFSLVLLPNSK